MTQNQPITTAVQVALRVRPLTQSDRSQPRFSHSTNSDVIKTYEKSIAIVPHQKTFQFDHVFDASSTQEQVFTSVASNFVDRFIDGYNVTILAYGQTSSGKTYTMGTAIDDHIGANPDQEGIIPRAMSALFHRLDDIQKESSPSPQLKRAPSVLNTFPPTSGLRAPRKSTSTVKLRPVSMMTPPRRGSNATTIPNTIPTTTNDKATRYTVHVSFIEIYNEELIDLLNPAPPHERAPVTIREDTKGHIIWTGLREVPVGNTEDVLRHLEMGTKNRATGSTDMNAVSSRSHAIFSVTLKQEKWVPSNKPATKTVTPRHSTLNVKALIGQMEKQQGTVTPPDSEQGEWMIVNSKFHFVDLAGSERLKRTAAEGDRRKEGININAGLLALGNVISALSDPSSKKSTHVPYRDSKLTRLLQDSLGGNSTTLMIACVSPAEINLTETINTIKYAYRARNIRNKSERNETEEWMTSDNLDHLRQIISKLKSEVKSLKGNSRGTPSPMSSNGSPKSHTFVHGIVSPSSSMSDNDPQTSISNTTTITPNSSSSLELFDTLTNNHHPTVMDLRRQIEELQNQVTVTRERNQLVEKELRQQKPDMGGSAFQHLVEPVIEEYEKSISGLESQLAMARAALTHSDEALVEQQAKIEEYQNLQSTEVSALKDLQDRLKTALDREQVSESYCLELEGQLEKAVSDGQRDQQILSELREKIMKFRDMDDHTEQYISDLEARLSTAETERLELTERIAVLSDRKLITTEETTDLLEKDLLRKELDQCQTRCEELEKELKMTKEQNGNLSTSEMARMISEKESHVSELDARLKEIEQMKFELSQLRDTHLEEIRRLEASMSGLKEQCVEYQSQLSNEKLRSQSLQDKIDTLEKSSDSRQGDIDQAKADYADLLQQMRNQESQTQITLQYGLDQLEKFKMDMNALHLVEEKQDAIIQGLELKLEEMDHLLFSLRSQLEARDQTIHQLETENAAKTEIAVKMKEQLDDVLKDVCGMGAEKKQLEQVMQVMEGTLRLQEVKSDISIETLQDIQFHDKVRQEEIEEKRKTVDLLSAEKQVLFESLQQASQRASQGDTMVKNLTVELDEARHSLTEQAGLVKELKHKQAEADVGIQRVRALEDRVQSLDQELDLQRKEKLAKEQEWIELEHAVQNQLVQNQGLVKTISELETTIKEERALASSQDSTGMLSELERKLESLQQTKKHEEELWKAQMESVEEELLLSRKESHEYSLKIKILEASLDDLKQQLVQSRRLNLDEPRVLPASDSENSESDLEDDLVCNSMDSSHQDLIEKILQLQEDNSQLLKHNDNLESQLILQRGQLTLETKNLELELMKLTAANDRLEKEMEQVIPRNNSSNFLVHNRDSMQYTSPPQTPRVSSPPPPSTSVSTGSLIHYKMQRDISTSSIAKLSKSGSYRSVSAMLQDNQLEEDNYKRLSSISMKSESNNRPTSSLRASRNAINSNNLPPPTAPPSNPLPPIPSPLPALPSSPTMDSSAGSEPGSPPMHPISINASSQSSLHRHDSTTSTSFSEIMNSTSSGNFTSEQYDKLIRSLQRKAQYAENDVKAHQDVITKLESQLSQSESSMREVKKQLDLLNREKQACSIEIENLRTQVSQIQTQQQSTTDESEQERKELEEKLEAQKILKEKAEKARRILEDRMDEIMSKKSKFMCF
ncbi:hypothetical protein INT47_003307 [Mucor saturninus]|uniref:Kinesin motor domain-containing protein n=1 Tax=Mucor saturninus TaxID=64648 RepID=A0A8H7V9B9_9FUNG|nr:hypothetical protein INT47_003307 [Mucor saturninus]